MDGGHMPRDVNTKMVVYCKTNLPSTISDVTFLCIAHGKTQTHNEGTKRLLALIALAASS